MAKYTTENIHTVALVGHGGAGKTTLTEALLWKTGVIGAMGSTERGSTVADFAALVHRDFAEKLKSARIWGSGVFDGQAVGREHILFDKDVVELHM